MHENTVFYALAFLLPACIASRLRTRGILIGAVVFWVLITAAFLTSAETPGLGWAFILLWIAFGWSIGFLYCIVIVAIKFLLIRIAMLFRN